MAKVGRHSKGDRHAFMTRVPRDAADRVMETADRLGISYSEYIAYLISNGVGLDTPLPTPTKQTTKQEELPLQNAS